MSAWRRLTSKTFTAVLRVWVCLSIRSKKIHTCSSFLFTKFVHLSSKLYYKWKLLIFFFNKLNNKITEIVHELYGQPSYFKTTRYWLPFISIHSIQSMWQKDILCIVCVSFLMAICPNTRTSWQSALIPEPHGNLP